MDQIKEALTGFAQMNGRLPCPARGATAAGGTDSSWGVSFSAGSEQYDATNKRCYTVLGVVPWTTLGVTETDAWGRRFTYRVSPAFSDDPSLTTWQTRITAYTATGSELAQTLTNPVSPANQSPVCAPTATLTFSSFALCTLGDIAVLTRAESNHATVTPLGTALPVVFISHGKNGNGAYQTNGIALAAAAASTDEAANSSGTTTATPVSGATYASFAFYSRNATPTSTTCDDTSGTSFCEFDDIVTMISASTLISRMVSAGRVP